MRKWLLGILIVIILIIILLPYFLGEVVAAEFKRQLLRFNANPDVIYATVDQYQTHWFHTNTTLLVTQRTPSWLDKLYPNKQLPKKIIYQVNLKIKHGPLVYTMNNADHQILHLARGVALGSIKLISPKPAVFSNVKGLSQPIKLFAVITMSGNVHLIVHTNQYQLTTPANSVITIKPAKLNTFINNASRIGESALHMKGNFQISGITANLNSKRKTNLTFSTITSRFNLRQNSDKFWTGTSKLVIPTITFSKENNALVTLDNLQLVANKSAQDDKMTVKQTVTVNQINILGYLLKSIKAVIEIDNINLKVAAELRKEVQQLKAVPQQQANQKIVSMLPKMLAGINYQLQSFKVITPFGLVEAHGQANIAKQVPQGNDPQIQLKDLLKQSTGWLDVSAPSELLDAIPLILGPGPVLPQGSKPMVSPQTQTNAIIGIFAKDAYQKGYLQKQGDRLVSKIIYKNKQLNINGKTINLQSAEQGTAGLHDE